MDFNSAALAQQEHAEAAHIRAIELQNADDINAADSFGRDALENRDQLENIAANFAETPEFTDFIYLLLNHTDEAVYLGKRIIERMAELQGEAIAADHSEIYNECFAPGDLDAERSLQLLAAFKEQLA